MIASNFSFCEVVLIAFPYTDLSATKKRPALVLYDTSGKDIIICRINSQAKETEFDIEITDWQSAGLKFPSTARLHKITTIEAALIDKRMGQLPATDLVAVKTVIKKVSELI